MLGLVVAHYFDVMNLKSVTNIKLHVFLLFIFQHNRHNGYNVLCIYVAITNLYVIHPYP
jgi:hypothetical protein